MELIVQALAAMELKLDIIESTQSQQTKLQTHCTNKLSEHVIQSKLENRKDG